MQKLHLFLLLLFSSVFSAQAQQSQEQQWIQVFLEAFNEKQYQQIYQDFSPSLQSELTVDKAEEFFAEIQQKMGDILNIEHLNSEPTTFSNGSVGLIMGFKLEFENGEVALLSSSINKQQQIEGFSLSEFPDKQTDMSFLDDSVEKIIFDSAQNLSVNTQISVAVINQKQVAYYGFIQNKKGLLPVENKTTLFSLGTLGSIFTSTALSKAVLDNKVSYTQNASEFYEFPFHENLDFLVSELASNVSGIEFNDNQVTTQEALRTYSYEQLLSNLEYAVTKDSVFGQRFSFIGNSIVGDIVSKVNQQPLPLVIEQQIFKAYHMDNSYFNFPKKVKNFAIGYDGENKKVKPTAFNAFQGASFGYSSVEDVSRFVVAHFNPNDQVLAFNRRPSAMVGPDLWIANGWKVALAKDAQAKVYHNVGFSEGYYNYIAFDPIAEKAVVFMLNASNTSGSKVIEELSFKLTAKLFGQ